MTAKDYNDRGLEHFNKGEYDLAIEAYNKVIELNPNDATAYYNRGNAYRGKGITELQAGDFEGLVNLKYLAPQTAVAPGPCQ